MKNKNNSLTDFEKRVLRLAGKIPCGKVTTYKIIAYKIKNKNYSRAVAKALSKNQDLQKTACYRVIRSNGEIGGYKNGEKQKLKLLKKDGIKIKNKKVVDLNSCLWG